jgi:dihydropteroate synthase
MTGPATPLGREEREGLGIPDDLPLPPAGIFVRLEGLRAETALLLSRLSGESGGSVRALREKGGTTWVAGISGEGWDSFLRSLAPASPALAEISRELRALLRAGRLPARNLRLGRRRLRLGRRTLIQGILNVTPDSFHDGGQWLEPGRAVERAFRMAEEGAGVVDLGGASTRPGSRSIPAREEARRILPVLKALAGRLTVPISVDTTQSSVAAAALDAGAEIVNDISGLTFDPRLASVVARHDAGLVLSHIQGRPRSMQRRPRYRHLLPEVVAFLRRAIRRATEAGVHPESILVDPGIGFGKTAGHNLLLLRHLRVLQSAGRPILVGASRKSFLSMALGREGGTLEGGSEERLEGSLAVAALAVYNGAAALRVHDVAETVRAARVAEAVRDAALRAGKG